MQTRIITWLVAVLMLLIGVSSAATISDQNPGAPEIRLDGGTRGPVDFPHQRHQQKLGDCNTCHAIFPQVAGAVMDLKNQGKLKRKQVMDHCRQCHRSMAKAGEATGPTSCNKCHRK